MEPAAHPRSFSAGRRWGIFFSVLVSIAAFVALMLMLNYLGARHFLRFSWRADQTQKLSPMTLGLLGSITNDVSVILYYDREDPLYDDISDLLKEYHFRNSKITIQNVDYHLDPVTAQKIKLTYGLGSTEDKNLIILASGDRFKIVPGDQLATAQVERLPDEPTASASGPAKPNFVRHLSTFNGESILDGCLLTVTSKKPFLACYVMGHSEAPLDDKGALGYAEFYSVLRGCNVYPLEISLAGTNEIPAACSLLIIAGPVSPAFSPGEVQKVRAFLATGGRLFVLFHYAGMHTGLEPLLADWGVDVGMNSVTDPENVPAADRPGSVPSILVDQFYAGDSFVNPLVGSRLHLFAPRSIHARPVSGNNVPTVTELASTSPGGRILSGTGVSGLGLVGSIPLMAAVEKTIGVGAAERGETRLVVVGDSVFMANSPMKDEDNGNEDFARLAVNWLLDETPAMQNVGPRRMVEYKLKMTTAQMRNIWWVFLVGLPGGILLFGGLVWLRRRQ